MTDGGIFQDLAQYVHLGKETLDLLRAAGGLLPQSAKRAEVEQKIAAAEDALKRADAALAQKLGFQLCQCTYPPQIMLWREREKVTKCPNPECGRTIKDVSEAFNRPRPSPSPYV
jgi:hypothetical protein